MPLRTGIENPQHCFQAASSAISFPMRAIARLISRKGRTCTIGGWFEANQDCNEWNKHRFQKLMFYVDSAR